jgi:hypothetical protein
MRGIVPSGRNGHFRAGLSYVAGSTAGTHFAKGEAAMTFPKAISTWCMILFFLFWGLGVFVAAIPNVLTAIFALAAAVFLFLGR